MALPISAQSERKEGAGSWLPGRVYALTIAHKPIFSESLPLPRKTIRQDKSDVATRSLLWQSGPQTHQPQSWTGLVYPLTKPDGGGSSTLLTEDGRTSLRSDLSLLPSGGPAQGGNYTSPPHCAAILKPFPGHSQENKLVLTTFIQLTSLLCLCWVQGNTKLGHSSCPPLSCTSGQTKGQAPREAP